ncbi:pentapeptide repeat-containing protein [Spirillospora sp. NPDC049652]
MSDASHYPFDALSSPAFEQLCVELLRRLGYQNVDWRKGSAGESSGADGGYDIEATLPRTDPDGHTWQERWFIECKQRRRRPLRYGETESLRDLHEEADVLLVMLDGQLTLQTRQKFEKWRHRRPRTRLQIWEREHLESLYDKYLRTDADQAGTALKAFLEASDRTSHENTGARRSAFTVLERIGVANPDLRQGVVDEICLYLRAPARQGADEPKLRLYLQNVLRRRLTAWDENSEPTDGAWTGMSLDLSGAELTDFTFLDGSVHRADFAGSRFAGSTSFQGTRFGERADFSNASFAGGAFFTGCEFFLAGADFRNATFRESCTFHRASFEGMADFSGAHFKKEASFLRTRFADLAEFSRAVFQGGVTYERATFDRDTHFTDTDFSSMGHFGEAYFRDVVSFDNAVPVDSIDLHHALAEPSFVTRAWPDGWSSAFSDCLAVGPVEEAESAISQDGAGRLCQDCRPQDVCRLRPAEQD